MDIDSKRLKATGLALVLLVVGAAQFGLFWVVGDTYLEGYTLGIGSIGVPRAEMVYFLAFWAVLGGGAVVAMAFGMGAVYRILDLDERLPWAGPGPDADGRGARDGIWLAVGMVMAAAVPALIRGLVLQGAPLTDDEASYRFMARLLASGRVAGESAPEGLRLFFDRFQMVNGGRWYTQYFVGWPALMVPGVWLDIENWMNVVYSALTVPPLFWTARMWFGGRAARWSVVLYVGSPFLMVAAAGVGAHTSCMAALGWALYLFARSGSDAGDWRHDAGFGTAFSVAFFVRPLTALGLGAPLLVIWCVRRLRRRNRESLWRAVALAVPSLVFAALFLAVNQAQSGSPFTPAYTAYRDFVIANDGRFSDLNSSVIEGGVPNLALGDVWENLATQGLALFRFNFALFGWPCSLLLACFAGFRRRGWVLWGAVLSFFGCHLLVADAGIDLYGPVHYMELALPFVLLSAAGLVRARRGLAEFERGRDGEATVFLNRHLPGAAVATCMFLTAGGYLPVRMGAVGRIAEATRAPFAVADQLGLEKAVVFAPRPFVSGCVLEHSRHYVFWRPTNSPDLDDSVLWVNHISVDDDRRFMRYAPGRDGYLMFWTQDCKLRFVPLENVEPGAVPEGYIGGSGEGPDWGRAPSPEAYAFPEPAG